MGMYKENGNRVRNYELDILHSCYFFLVHAVVWNIFTMIQAIKAYRFLKQNWSPENFFKYYYNKYIGQIEIPTEDDIQLLRNILTE